MTESSPRTSLNYREDIDGLRAVAVLLVVFFHLGMGFPGGFIGVDVFFVISGYLITAQIEKHHASGSLNLMQFWIRRIKRILPAAIVLALVVLVAGYFLLFARDYKNLAQSVLSQQFLLANVFFWRTTDYFGGASETKPMLHCWSLAVEEQFYLFYPLLLAVTLKSKFRSHVREILIVVFVISLLVSELGVRVRPVATFYLLPTRTWELLAGGILVFLPTIPHVWRWRREAVCMLAAFLILAPAVAFNSKTVFPGLNATAPVLGATLLIWAGTSKLSLVSRLISAGPCRFIGLISYSLYLWHWPLLAFAHYWLGATLSAYTVSTIFICSFLLASLSWRFVETPIRKMNAPSAHQWTIICSLSSTAVVAAIASVIVLGEGLPNRLPAEIAVYERAEHDRAYLNTVTQSDVENRNLPTFGENNGKGTCLVWGDSHAMVLIPGIEFACKQHGVLGIQITHPITAPILNFAYTDSPSGLGKLAPAFSDAVFRYIIEQKIDFVVMSGKWAEYAKVSDFETQLRETIERLVAAKTTVIIVLDVAAGDDLNPKAMARQAFWGTGDEVRGTALIRHRQKNQKCDELIRRAGGSDAIILDPADVFVDDDDIWRAEIDGEVMYFDNNHLSRAGGTRLGPLFLEVFDEILPTRE